jgi:hypothetical protein
MNSHVLNSGRMLSLYRLSRPNRTPLFSGFICYTLNIIFQFVITSITYGILVGASLLSRWNILGIFPSRSWVRFPWERILFSLSHYWPIRECHMALSGWSTCFVGGNQRTIPSISKGSWVRILDQCMILWRILN